MNLKNIALWGFAAFGVYKGYEMLPLKIEFNKVFAGRANMGSIEEAMLWEQAGNPAHTRMGSRNKRRR